MIHEKAKQWDEEHKNEELPPKNRPCDWCGEVVDRGYVHESCMALEKEKWLNTPD